MTDQYVAIEVVVRIGNGLTREDLENAILHAAGCVGDEPDCRMQNLASTVGTLEECETWFADR